MKKVNPYQFKARMVRIIDGDTISFDVMLGFYLTARVRVRLQGVDTPEIYSVKKDSAEYKEGMKASQFVEDWFEKYGKESVIIETQKTGKYGRWLAVVKEENGDRCLNTDLSEQGW